jgi:hypothetical protein
LNLGGSLTTTGEESYLLTNSARIKRPLTWTESCGSCRQRKEIRAGDTFEKLSSQKLLTGDLYFDVIKAISMIISFFAFFLAMTTHHSMA